MAAIILPDKWSGQPTAPHYPDLSPDWASVIGFATLTGRAARMDAKSRAIATVTGTIDVTGSIKGPASLPASANTTRLSWTGIKPVAAMGDGYALLVFAAPPAVATIMRPMGLGDVAASAYNNVALLFNTTRTSVVSVGRFALIEYSGGDKATAETGTTSTDGNWHVFLANRPGGTSAPILYVDGIDRTTASGANAGVAFTSGVHVHGQPTTVTEGYNGPMALAVAFNRSLSTEEIATLSRNPWQIFRKQSRIYFLPSAGGGGATIAGDSGTYTLTGSDVSLKAGRKLAADSGSYSLSGTDAAFKRGYALVASSGTYTVSGTAVSLKAGRKLAADSGSYTLTGTDATLTYAPAGSYNLTAESGSYSLTGTAATLKVSRKLSADSGAYSLTGTTATLAKGVRMAAASGSYTLTGSNVSFARTYVLTAESGSYTLTGTSAGLTWSGAPVVEVPTNGGPSIYGKPVFREREFRREYEEQVKRIEDEKRLARILREDEEIICIMALMAA